MAVERISLDELALNLKQPLQSRLKQALNVNTHFENIGRSYFPTRGETLDVGFGKEVRVVVVPFLKRLRVLVDDSRQGSNVV